MNDADGPIESYLDELLDRLQGSARDVRRTLGEAEDHLYSRADAEVAAGRDRISAETAAIAQFGSAATVADAMNAALPLGARPGLLRSLAGQSAALVGVGLVAVGVSGLVEQAMTGIWGKVFVFADPPGTRYSAGSCRYWEAIHPHASSCTQAYIAESMADGLAQRYAAGLLGAGLLLVCMLLRRRRGLPVIGGPGGFVPALLGTAAFGAAAVGLTALGADRLNVSAGNGAGQWLSAALVSLACAGAYLWALVRRVRREGLPNW